MAKRRLLSFLLAAILVASSLPLTAAAVEDETAATDTDPAADAAAVANVESLIAAIGEITPYSATKYPMLNARKAYDALADELKPLVKNYDVLVFIEKSFNNAPAASDVVSNSGVIHSIYCAQYGEFIRITGRDANNDRIIFRDPGTNADGVYFVELDASGNEVGSPITPAGTYSATTGSSLLTINKADEVFDRIEIPTEEETVNVIGSNNTSLQRPQTNTVPDTDGFGFTIQLTGSDDVILKPGKYNFNGDFRLGWFDHSKLVFEDGSFNMIAADNNTAPLQAYMGSTQLGSATLNPSTWTNVSKSFEITEETPMSKLKIEVGAIVPVDYKNLTLELVEFGSASGDAVGKITPTGEGYIAVRGRDYYEDSVAYVDTTTTYDSCKDL